MRLFQALCRRKMPGGDIWRGKYRLVRDVTKENVVMLRNSLEIEEKNMFYLRHAYLTPEQSYGHAQALGKLKKQQLEHIYGSRRPPHGNLTLETALGHLRHGEAWD